MRRDPRSRTASRVAIALGVAVGVVLSGPEAGAQRSSQIVVDPPRVRRGEPGVLRGRMGVSVAERLVFSADPEQRLRGVTRLGAIGTAEAIDALVAALGTGAQLGSDPRARLEAIRVLAPHAKKEAVVQLLVRELTTPGPESRASVSALGGLARDTAALALARSGDKRSLTHLVTALLQRSQSGERSAAAEAAARALRAHPPATLLTLVGEGKKPIATPIAEFLGDLGDLRAIDRLRAALEQPGEIDLKIAAAIALAKLGDERPAALARGWIKRADPKLIGAGAAVLTHLGAPDARAAIARLLGADSTRREGVRLALLVPGPELAGPLAAAVPMLPAEERGPAVAALGRAGGPTAISALIALLAKPELTTGAAYALARMPGDEARVALERAAASTRARPGPARRLIVRAAVARAVVLADPPAGVEALLEAMLASTDRSDQAVGAFGLVATGARPVTDFLAGKEPAAVRAAMRGALARGPRALAACMPLLAAEAAARGEAAGDPTSPPSTAAVAAGVALLADPTAGPLSTTVLAAWAEGGGPLAPLAARALPSRDDEAVRPRIRRLLAGTDPVVRAHVALGLGRDPEADAVSVLGHAYRFEEDAGVRRAIVRGLSRRSEVQRLATLKLARDLDPDDGVRALARAALEGRVLDHVTPATLAGEPSPAGPAMAWISIVPNHASALAAASERGARLARSDGLAVPVVADPDGVLLVPGLPEGAASLLLAPAPPPGKDPR